VPWVAGPANRATLPSVRAMCAISNRFCGLYRH